MIESKTAEVAAYWAKRRGELGIAATDYHVCTFADTALSQNVDMIGNLAVTGRKKATSA